MAAERVPKEYSNVVFEKIIGTLLRRIENLENAQTAKKIGSIASDAAPLLKAGELAYMRDDSQNLSLVVKADDGRIYTIGALASSSSSVVSSSETLDHGNLAGLADDDHTQYVLRSIMTTKGDLFSYSTVVTRVAAGSDGQLLIPDTPSTSGLKWGNLIFNGDVLVANDNEIVTI